MSDIAWIVIGAIFLWLATVSAFIVGAYAVFKTKREPHEGFFQVSPPKGEAFNLDDPLMDEAAEPLPSLTEKMNEKFKSQMAGGG